MTETSEQFWERAVLSGALTEGQHERLRPAWDRRSTAYSADPRSLAKWLIARGAITTYQAKILLAGKAGPFRFGAYRVVDRLRREGGGHFLVAVHNDTDRQVVLHFFTAATRPADEAAARAATEQALAKVGRDLGRVSRYLEVGGFRFTVIEPPAGPQPDEGAGTAAAFAPIAIDIDAEPHHAVLTRRIPRSADRRRPLYLGLGMVALVVVAAGVWWAATPGDGPPTPVVSATENASIESTEATTGAVAENDVPQPYASRERVVPDDGELLWASPTGGDPISLEYLPSGSQILCLIRPYDLLHDPEGPRVIAALGPWGQAAIDALENDLKCPLAGVDSVLVGIQPSSTAERLLTSIVAELRPEAIVPTRHRWKTESQPRMLADQTVLECPDRIAWFPPAGEDRLLIVCPGAVAGDDWMTEVIAADATAPPVRREMEQLLSVSDRHRHVTLLAAPSFLFNQQANFFTGRFGRLRESAAWLLGGEVGTMKAVALSVHFADSFFVEFRGVATAEVSPRTLAEGLGKRVGQIALAVEDYIISLPQIQPYGRRVVMRLPAMIRRLAAYTRVGIEDDQAVLRAYLPAVAGHNLLMATDLVLHESAEPRRAGEVPAPATTRPIGERLATPISLSFDRETLEDAIRLWSESAEIAVELLGSDLQLEGITKNQSLGIDLTDQPAQSILLAILTAANPDATATGPSDPNHKLIYVVKPAQEGGETKVFITTRAQAQARGDTLPEVFQ